LPTDTGLEESTSQIRSHIRSTLLSSSAQSPSLFAIHSPRCAISHTLTHRDTITPHLSVRLPQMLHIPHLERSLL
jgi:hypothetical protein